MNSGQLLKSGAFPLYSLKIALKNSEMVARGVMLRLSTPKRAFYGVIVFTVAWLALITSGTLAPIRLVALAEPVEFYEGWLGGPLDGLVEPDELSCPALANANLPTTAHSCFYRPESGPIAQVVVRVSHDRVEQLQYAPRGDVLKVGDLIARWGRPEVTLHQRRSRLNWPGPGIEAITDDRSIPLNYQAPVRRVTISAPALRGQAGAGNRLSPQLVE